MNNPFVFGKIVSDEYFIDREEEQKRLRNNLLGGINSVLISPRRWGKSSLVAKVARSIEKRNKKIKFCFLDLFNVRSEEEFYTQLARELLRISATKWEEQIDNAKKFFRTITPSFKLGVDPDSDLSLSFDWKELKKTPEEILNLPEKICKEKKIKIIVCIDEFQNVDFFSNPTAFQKKLRANWQHHKLAGYCLYGSKRHLMMQLFENKSMPFYKFGDVMFLTKIEESYWTKYISSHFKKTRKEIHDKIALQISRDMENHPYFVQQLAYTAWTYTIKQCAAKEYNSALQMLLMQQTILFQKEIESLTNPQINFLKAVCDNVAMLSASDTLQNYKLGTSANVSRIKYSLVNKEILDITAGGIEFLDPLFKLWFKTIYMSAKYSG